MTDEDLQAITAASMQRFADEHPDDDWGYDDLAEPIPGGNVKGVGKDHGN